MPTLPNGDRADVPLERLTLYLLNPDHPVGKHKARVFAAALGLRAADAAVFQTWLQEVARTGQAEAVRADRFGQRFVIRRVMRYSGKEALVRTAWIARPGRAAPEFLTAIVE